MARRSRLQIVKRDIQRVFEETRQRVFTRDRINEILQEHAPEWRLPISVTTGQFIQFLVDNTPLKEALLESESYSNAARYTWGDDVSPFELALSLREKGYLSHGTAVFLHGLTLELPKTIYLNTEQTPKPRSGGSLTQERIDWAFGRQQRTSNDTLLYGGYRFVRVSGKATGRLEVGTISGPHGETLEVTKLERTLIDIAVRPAYGGGVYKVAEAFQSAKDRMSVNTLVATLKKLDHIYPYHQAIGFYMQRAGYEPRRLEPLRKLGMKVDFYLTHGMNEKDYDPGWRLFFPKGM